MQRSTDGKAGAAGVDRNEYLVESVAAFDHRVEVAVVEDAATHTQLPSRWCPLLHFSEAGAMPGPMNLRDGAASAIPHGDLRRLVVADYDRRGLERRRQERGAGVAKMPFQPHQLDTRRRGKCLRRRIGRYFATLPPR